MVRYFPHHVFVSGDPFGATVAMMEKVTDPTRRRRIEEWLENARKASAGLWRPNAIARAGVGTVLLTSLKRSIPVWIVPYEGDGRNAITGQISSDLQQGVRIR